MNQDHKFQQRWEFRRRDDEFDSSSDDAKSNSSGEPAYKRHKLVSNFILPEFDENGDEPGSQQNDQFEPNTQGHFEFGKANKMQIGSSKKRNSTKKKSSSKDKTKRKNKRIAHKTTVSLDDFNIFMKSILEELKVARENMFTCMREEMKKLGTIETAPRPTRKKGSCRAPKVAQDHHNGIEMGTETQNRHTGSLKRSLKSNGIADSNNRYDVHEELAQKVVHENHNGIEKGMETQICDSDSLKRSLKSNRAADTNNCYEVLDEQVNNEQDIGSNASNEKDKGERLRFSVRKLKYSSNPPDQVVSSAYLTLPTVLSKAQVDNHRLDSSSCNYIQRGATGNNTNVNLEGANLMIDSSSHHGYFSSIQQEEQFGSSAQLGSHSMGCINQHSTQTSSMATAFPVPLHKDLHNGFKFSSQVLLENSSRDNNILGTRMNRGAIRFSGGSYVLSEHFIPNNFHSHTNNKN
ncbi:uncharacterized protein LOC132283817 [Cornus florida]|uniref:uncharacterized protein LOC132283817 n=1 Tax=Cornus florida TaxID=4283 RepID=UPI0028A093CE|nr:uncharacterized protein LOC132283817 [Cornus florida]